MKNFGKILGIKKNTQVEEYSTEDLVKAEEPDFGEA